jgi:hypothetical protein
MGRKSTNMGRLYAVFVNKARDFDAASFWKITDDSSVGDITIDDARSVGFHTVDDT